MSGFTWSVEITRELQIKFQNAFNTKLVSADVSFVKISENEIVSFVLKYSVLDIAGRNLSDSGLSNDPKYNSDGCKVNPEQSNQLNVSKTFPKLKPQIAIRKGHIP